MYRIWSYEGTETQYRFGLGFWQRLETALLELAYSTLPQPETDRRIEQTTSDLINIVQKCKAPFRCAAWNFTLKPFGSYASKLHGRGSDVDLQIDGWFRKDGASTPSHAMQMFRRDAQRFIHVIGARLENMRERYKYEKIAHARTPIVKVEDLRRGVSCDIAFPSGDSVDYPKSELLLVLNHLDNRLHMVLTLVKRWAGNHHLRNAALGRFNTYTLTSMIVFFFQTLEKPIFPPLNLLVPPPLISAARRYEDMSSHVAGMAKTASTWRRDNVSNANQEGVMELFLGFLSWLDDLVTDSLGSGCSSEEKRPVRLSTYTATRRMFGGADAEGNRKVMYVDDPFDAEDNSARALSMTCFEHAGQCAAETLELCAELDVDEWVQRVFMDAKEEPKGDQKPRRARSKRYGHRRSSRGKKSPVDRVPANETDSRH